MKSANICVQGFLGIELGINLSAGCSVQFLFLWQELHPSIYCFISLVTSGYQKFLVTNSTVFHCPLYPPTGILWCSLIVSTLNILSLDIYTFLFLYIMPFTFFYSSSLSIFTPVHFISSTALTILLSFTFDFFTFSNKSTLSTITSTLFVFLTSSYSDFTNILSLLFFSTPTSQSGLLLKLSAFPILLPRTCVTNFIRTITPEILDQFRWSK